MYFRLVEGKKHEKRVFLLASFHCRFSSLRIVFPFGVGTKVCSVSEKYYKMWGKINENEDAGLFHSNQFPIIQRHVMYQPPLPVHSAACSFMYFMCVTTGGAE